MTISLVIPAFNEEKRLPKFLQSVVNYQASNPEKIHEIIVVDDGSTDNTALLARQHANVQVLSHKLNQGKGAAVQTGVNAATGSHIVFIDADGATDIDQMPKMIAALENAEIAVGSRWLSGSETDRSSLLRHISGLVYRNYMGLFGLKEVDTMCGFKGYKTEIAKKLFANLIDKRWLFDTEIAYKAKQAKYNVKNFPIQWESKSGSKLTTFDLAKAAFGIWPLIQKINRLQKSQE